MKTVYKILSEWDIGFDETVFETRVLARTALENAHRLLITSNKMDLCSVEDMFDEGLYEIREVKYIDGT